MAKFEKNKRKAIALLGTASIDYSVGLQGNPMNENDPQKAYASIQYAERVKLPQLAQHIMEHGSPYTRDMIVGVTAALIDCMREFLIEGHKVELDDLGTFYVTISNKAAKSIKEFTAANIEDAWVEYEPGGYFVDLKNSITWNKTVNRRMQAVAKKLFEAGRLSSKQWADFLKGDADFSIDAEGNIVPAADNP